MKKNIRVMAMVLTIVTVLMIAASMAIACGDDCGWYYINTTRPADHNYSYLYDRTSSSKGKNLGRVEDGEMVYVYWTEKNGEWAYVSNGCIEGYIRMVNLAYAY